MKKSKALVSSVLTFGAAGAFAQATPAPAAPEPVFPLTANVSVTTKYKFRGQDQGGVGSNDAGELTTKSVSPAIQGGFDWTAAGFYVGNWNSNIGFTNQGIEMDFYGGYKGEITKDFGFDVGILQYYYPQKDKSVNFDTTELYAALSWTFLTLKYSHTISNDYFGIGKSQSLLGATPKPKVCTCKSSFEELAMPSEVSVIDPDTGYPNEYAKRVKARNLADTAYLVLQERQGHAVAATTVCRHFGHDPSSGFCMRCGARVGYDFE